MVIYFLNVIIILIFIDDKLAQCELISDCYFEYKDSNNFIKKSF